MDAVTLALAKKHTNEQVIQKATNSPTEIISFDCGAYSLPSTVVNGQVNDVRIKGQTWTNLAGAGDTSPQTVDSLDATKTYLLINSAGANVTIDTVDTPTPVKLTGATSFDFGWASGKIALYELSAEETALDASVLGQKYHYVSGTKSTISAMRLKSVGKNLMPSFDEWDIGSNIYINQNEIQVKFNNLFSSPFIKINPNTGYVLSFTRIGGVLRNRLCYYDENKNLIENTAGSLAIIWKINHPTAKYVRWNYYPSSDETEYRTIKNMQLEYGTVSTEYEPYRESIAYIPEVGRSLPNGTKDEVSIGQNGTIKTQRVGTKVNVASSTVIDYADMATAGQFVAYYADGTQQVGVKGDTLTALAVSLNYQLAAPIVTKLPAQAPLQVFENGTVYVEPIGDPAESTVPSVEMTIPTGTSNKFGVATHNYAGAAADWVLTNSESKCFLLAVSNAGGSANIIAPDRPGTMYAISNASGQTVTVKISGGTGVAITNAKTVLVIHNGTDYTALTAEL